MHFPIQTAFLTIAATLLFSPSSSAAGLTVTLGDKAPVGVMADRYAFCPPEKTETANVSPKVTWSAPPVGTRSFALRMQDRDVPADFSQIEKPGVTIMADAPRISVDHWLLADIPATFSALSEGADSTGSRKGGKPTGRTDHGVRGINIYASFFASNPDMAGPYGGYDGPCPPRNDEKAHRYVVEVFALDTENLPLPDGFTGDQMVKAMEGHILAKGSATATYSRWERAK